MYLSRSLSLFLCKIIMTAVYGLSSLLSILFLLRPYAFNKSLLLRVLLCTSYILSACEVFLCDQGMHSCQILSQKLLRILNIFILSFPVLIHQSPTSNFQGYQSKKMKSAAQLKGFGGKRIKQYDKGKRVCVFQDLCLLNV